MERSDAVMARYQRGYDAARTLYENDQLDEAVEEAEKMLADGDLPRYHRIKLYLLVALCLDDWIEADDLVERAESQWGMARGYIWTKTGAPLPVPRRHRSRANSS